MCGIAVVEGLAQPPLLPLDVSAHTEMLAFAPAMTMAPIGRVVIGVVEGAKHLLDRVEGHDVVLVGLVDRDPRDPALEIRVELLLVAQLVECEALALDLLPVRPTHGASSPRLVSRFFFLVSFEESLQQLTELVEKLESGQLLLEESVAAFESGVQLSRHCEALLDHAEQRLQILNDQDSEQ